MTRWSLYQWRKNVWRPISLTVMPFVGLVIVVVTIGFALRVEPQSIIERSWQRVAFAEDQVWRDLPTNSSTHGDQIVAHSRSLIDLGVIALVSDAIIERQLSAMLNHPKAALHDAGRQHEGRQNYGDVSAQAACRNPFNPSSEQELLTCPIMPYLGPMPGENRMPDAVGRVAPSATSEEDTLRAL